MGPSRGSRSGRSRAGRSRLPTPSSLVKLSCFKRFGMDGPFSKKVQDLSSLAGKLWKMAGLLRVASHHLCELGASQHSRVPFAPKQARVSRA